MQIYFKKMQFLFKKRQSLWPQVLLLLSFLLTPLTLWAQTEHIVGNVRVQALSPSLVRIELKGPNGFENRPTFHITQRSWPGATLTSTVTGNYVYVTSSTYTVRIPATGTTLDGITVTKPDGTQLWSMPSSQAYTTIKNRWKGTYLFDNGDSVGYGATAANDSYYWAVEKVDGYTRFRNKATGDYLNIENLAAYVQSTPVQSYWHSKDWTLESVEIPGYFRLRARWAENPHYIHVEDQLGYAEHAAPGTTNASGAPLDQWTSAQWAIEDVSFFNDNRRWIPHPKEATMAWAIVDTPRMVPASWGYNYPGTAQVNNGWDLNNNSQDVYVFLPNGDGKKLRSDYIQLTGHSEMLPLYAFGGWDSRYYAYTQAEALGKIDKYRAKNIPLDVFVVDTDWRVGASSGYGVNTTLFPDMTGFLASAHAKNVRVPFNDHPEPRATALDPVEVKYRNDGLRALFNIGLDFWWFDRNWHVTLDPPPSINKEVFGMYVYDSVIRDYYPNRRPIIMANVDGIDNGDINNAPNIAAHRFTMQWTGDTFSDYDSLKREIRNAVYNGVYAPFAYTSTDLGGHKGTLTVEQYARWVQFGALSPIFRLHCGQGYTRDPWDYAAPAESVVRKFVQMRMRLLPVFYALARDNYETGEPILRRLDLDYPTYADAARNDQYLLGKNILIAPISETGNSRAAWIPPGTWINVWDGSTVTGPATITANANQEQMPIFVKRNSLIALAPDMQYTSERRWDPVTLDVYPQPDNTATTTLYEDDGMSNSYKSGSYRKTALSSTVNNVAKTITVKIAASSGTYSGAQANRAWKIRVRTPSEWNGLGAVNVTVNGAATMWNNLGKDSTSMPFQVTGGAADSEISEINLSSQAVATERTIVISYGTPAFSRQVEAEAYTSMAGVQLEATTDTGGGQNVGWIDANDWMAYANINFPTSGNYKVEYRVASPSGSTLSLDLNAGSIQLGQLAIPATGGWQNWTTISHTVNITAGTYAVGVFAPAGGWNINWIKFTKI